MQKEIERSYLVFYIRKIDSGRIEETNKCFDHISDVYDFVHSVNELSKFPQRWEISPIIKITKIHEIIVNELPFIQVQE